jgi:transposase
MIEKAKLIARHLPNILTYFTHRITNAVAEGLNSKIATVQKRACGFRNRGPFQDRHLLPLWRPGLVSGFNDPQESLMNHF